MICWIEMGDQHTTEAARTLFLRTSQLGRPSVRKVHRHLLAREGLHTTTEVARAFGLHPAVIRRRLRLLAQHGLVRQIKGPGRKDPGGVGGRECDLWAAIPETCIDKYAARVVGIVTMGEALARKGPE